MLKSWSRTQGSEALSSGEAEFYAAIKGACEGLGIKSLLDELGFQIKVEAIQDSTAAKGTASRAGIGKIKHLDVVWLWIQSTVKKGEIKLMKIDGKVNPADFLTIPKSVKETWGLSEALKYDRRLRKATSEELGPGILEVAAWIGTEIQGRNAKEKKRCHLSKIVQ